MREEIAFLSAIFLITHLLSISNFHRQSHSNRILISLKMLALCLQKPNLRFTNRNISLYASFSLLILVTLNSCKKENQALGLDLLPEGDMMEATYNTGSTIKAWSIVDTAAKSSTKSVVLGSAFDPIFGKTEASFYAQLRPDNLIADSVFASTFQNSTIDSLVLSFVYNSSLANIYGNGSKSEAAQLVKIYRLTEAMNGDSSYNSNRDFAYDNSTPIGEGWIYPAFTDSVNINWLHQAPQVRIKLSANLANELKNAASYQGGMKIKDADTFLEFFKGIYVTAENPSGASNSGCFYYFDLSADYSGMRMYYHTSTGSDNVTFKISDKSASYSRFKHETSTLESLSNLELNKQTCYVQAMQGMKTRLFFPALVQLAKEKRVAIVDAQLTITPKEGTYGTFRRPSRISALKILVDGTIAGPEDAYELTDPTSYGAELLSDGTYVLNITRYLQNRIKAGVTDYGLDILRPGGSLYADRLIFNGPESTENPLQLKVKYIELK